jgi:hypothetical protein
MQISGATMGIKLQKKSWGADHMNHWLGLRGYLQKPLIVTTKYGCFFADFPSKQSIESVPNFANTSTYCSILKNPAQ